MAGGEALEPLDLAARTWDMRPAHLRHFRLRLSALALGLTLLGPQSACAQPFPAVTQTLALSAPAVWLAAEGPQIYAITAAADLLGVYNGQATRLAKNFSSAFITACAGRVVGVNDAGQLRVWNGRVVQGVPGAALSPLAHPLCLPSGIVAVSRAGDLLRFEPTADGWRESARTAARALPDAQLNLADLDGSGEAVVALTRPDAARYAHGILGDAVEATELTLFERHSLKVRSRLRLSDPLVFEDLQARPVRLTDYRDVLAVVRSSPSGGGALALVEGSGNTLTFRAVGPDFGQPSRWLAPVVGFGQLWAVRTPHIGGQLVRYTPVGDTLKASAPFGDLSNHSIGSRNLNEAVLSAPNRLVVPSQDRRRLLALDCRAACRVTGQLALRGTLTSNLLSAGSQVFAGDSGGTLHSWTVR